MARPADPQRREALLDDAVKFLSRSGLGNVSMRTLAAALDVTAPTLLYHFESKEKLIIEVLDAVEAEELAAVEDNCGDLASKLKRYWLERTGPDDLERFRLQIEAVCLSAAEDALPAPVRARICTNWVDAIQKDLESMGVSKDKSRSYATILHATQAGLLTDLLATGDRKRVDQAQAVFADLLELILDQP